MTDQKTYSIEIAGVKRDLRLFEIKPGLRIAILNILEVMHFFILLKTLIAKTSFMVNQN